MKLEKEIAGTTAKNMSELQAELITLYMEWATNCTKQDISHSIIIDILCYGIGCRQSDKLRRIKVGSSKKHLIDGLQLYSEMRGWVNRTNR